MWRLGLAFSRYSVPIIVALYNSIHFVCLELGDSGHCKDCRAKQWGGKPQRAANGAQLEPRSGVLSEFPAGHPAHTERMRDLGKKFHTPHTKPLTQFWVRPARQHPSTKTAFTLQVNWHGAAASYSGALSTASISINITLHSLQLFALFRNYSKCYLGDYFINRHMWFKYAILYWPIGNVILYFVTTSQRIFW